ADVGGDAGRSVVVADVELVGAARLVGESGVDLGRGGHLRAGAACREPLRRLPGADAGPGRGDRGHPGRVGADGGQPVLFRRPGGLIRMSGLTLAGPVDFVTSPITDVVGGGAKAVAAQMLSMLGQALIPGLANAS